MTEYFEGSELVRELTVAGVLYLADRDNDGQLTSTEYDQFITPSVVYAGYELDFYVSEVCEPAHARGSGNRWLADRGLAIAVQHFCGIGGNSPPEEVVNRATRARELLDRIKAGERIPNLIYPESARSRRSTRIPRIRNVH